MKKFARVFIGLTTAGLAVVAACGDDGNGPEPLPAPTGVAVVALSPTVARVSWNAVSGATTYLVQRATSPSTSYTTLSGSVSGTQYDDATVAPNNSYNYRVAARAGSDTSAFSSVIAFSIGVSTLDGTADITANRTLFKDTLYVLSGYVKVASGVTLTIQAGTKIVGDTNAAGSSLWILRGARIVANGTAAEPIVFTSQRAPGNRKPGDWGGIILVGSGIINRTGTILTEGPTGESENYGGGADNADSSGVLRYVRIEFAGYDVTGTGSELNGLSMYAIGSKTVVEYVETLSGLDDSFEWWGGAVDARYLVSYESGDDHFDWSEGYVGRVQFAIGLQSTRLTPTPGTGSISTDPQGFEADGCSGSGCAANPHRSEPYSDPTFANVTLVGSGAVETQAAGGVGAVLRRGTKGLIHNTILARWKGTGISVRDSVTGNILAADSLNLTDIVYAENTRGNHDSTTGANFGFSTVFTADNHRNATTAASIITNLTPASLDWKPIGIAATGCGTITIPATRSASFFGGTMPNTTYCGAVDPAAGAPWYQGWTSHAVN